MPSSLTAGTNLAVFLQSGHLNVSGDSCSACLCRQRTCAIIGGRRWDKKPYEFIAFSDDDGQKPYELLPLVPLPQRVGPWV